MSASDHRLYFLLQRTAHALKTRADSALAEAGGLTTAQAAALIIVASDGPVSQKAIAEKLMQRESAVTTMVDRLMKAGYVARKRSPADARAWLLEATPTGLAALDEAQAPFAEINALLDDAFADCGIPAVAGALEDLLVRLSVSKASD